MLSVNSDGLTPLDVAFLSNNRDLVRLLLAHGATEGKRLKIKNTYLSYENKVLKVYFFFVAVV